MEAVAVALAGGMTEAEAAAATGRGARTIRTWLATCPSFPRRIAQLRAGMTERALGKMAESMAEAADTLRQLLRSESDAVKLGAARSILELSLRIKEATELEERIRALEERSGRK
jgi:hypothetical protein